MAKKRLRDLVIVLPGITGSVLQKDGKDIWAISAGAAWAALTTKGASLRSLTISGDDHTRDDLGDGVTAPRLIDGFALMPGLMKSDGYGRLVRMIEGRFDVTTGSADPADQRPANLIPFPYDWRRDNRAAARRLDALIQRKLPQWRAHSGADDAKVILVAHSMGGLISRYYLECLGGWREARALVTFGTPYRGAVNALGFLANGYKAAFVDLTEVLRSCTSVYQLAPVDPVVKVGGSFQTPDTLSGVGGIDQARMREARAFHKAIFDAVAQRERDDGEYTLLPFAGRRQPTLQSATVSGASLSVSHSLPDGIDPALGDGDGTVPLISAIPPEYTDRYYDTFFSESHALIQSNDAALDLLEQRIERMQQRFPRALLGPQEDAGGADRPAISVEIDDAYLAGEEAVAHARVQGGRGLSEALSARIEPVDGGSPIERPLIRRRRRYDLPLGDLPAGVYRVWVRATDERPDAPSPVGNLVVVGAQAE